MVIDQKATRGMSVAKRAARGMFMLFALLSGVLGVVSGTIQFVQGDGAVGLPVKLAAISFVLLAVTVFATVLADLPGSLSPRWNEDGTPPLRRSPSRVKWDEIPRWMLLVFSVALVYALALMVFMPIPQGSPWSKETTGAPIFLWGSASLYVHWLQRLG